MSEEEAVKKRWYVVQAYSQYESRVKKTLLEYIKMHEMEKFFGQVLRVGIHCSMIVLLSLVA